MKKKAIATDIASAMYLLIVWHDIEPKIQGPFATEFKRDAAAKKIIKADPRGQHGIFKLYVCPNDKGVAVPEIYAYSGFETNAMLAED
jgi:hypothetical protein